MSARHGWYPIENQSTEENPPIASDLSEPAETVATSEALVDARATKPFHFVNERLITRQSKRAVGITVLLSLILLVAAIFAFPEMEDGYLLLALKEQGPGALLHAHLQGPLTGWLLRGLAQVSGVYFWPIAIVLNSLLWIIYGIVSCSLWVRLFPNESGYAPLIACLTIAPVVLEIQTTTVGVAPGLLGAILGYSSLLLILRCLRGGSIWLCRLGLFLVPVSILLSVDAAAVALVSLVLIRNEPAIKSDVPKTRLARRVVFAIAGLATLSLLLYLLLSSRSVDPSRASHTVSGFALFASVPPAVITQAWHATIGAYGALLANLSLSWNAIPGLLLAALFTWILTSRITEAGSTTPTALVKPQRLIVALLAGLTFLAFRHTSPALAAFPREAESDSQFLLPVMPVAAMLTALMLVSVVRLRVRPFVLTILALLIGFTLFNFSWNGLRRQQMLSSIGEAAKPYVKAADANVLSVLSTEDLCFADYSCTAKATSHWSGDLSKRFWLYKQSEALSFLGSRRECKSNSQVAAGNPVLRTGPISRLLWIQVSGNTFNIEPYCLSDTGESVAATHSAVASTKVSKGLLTSSFTRPAGTQNLTELGTADWAYWTSAATVNHKSTGGKQIFYYNTVGGVVRDYSDHPFAFSWSDGAPTFSEPDARTGISMTGMGHGFQIAAPADGTQRKLSVYIGARKTQGKIQAHLSDGSAPDYTDIALNGEKTTAGMYTIIYRAGSSSQLLVVTYTQATNNPQGSISLQGATLVASDR